MGMMEARSPTQIRDKVTDLYGTALVANWKVWPMAQVRRIPTIIHHVSLTPHCS